MENIKRFYFKDENVFVKLIIEIRELEVVVGVL